MPSVWGLAVPRSAQIAHSLVAVCHASQPALSPTPDEPWFRPALPVLPGPTSLEPPTPAGPAWSQPHHHPPARRSAKSRLGGDSRIRRFAPATGLVPSARSDSTRPPCTGTAPTPAALATAAHRRRPRSRPPTAPVGSRAGACSDVHLRVRICEYAAAGSMRPSVPT